MNQKIKLLFVIESLTLAGSEKSLIALLSNLDSKKYEIDLQLFRYGNELEKFIPEYVNLLAPLDYTRFASLSWRNTFIKTVSEKRFSFFKAKVNYSINLQLKKRNHSEIAKLYWKKVKNSFSISPNEYDVAIAFAQGLPTFFVMDKVKAKKKITWVNANMQFPKNIFDFQESYYHRFDAIVCVTDGNKQHMLNIFPHLEMKFQIIPDIIDYKYITQQLKDKVFSFPSKEFNILTVSRLDDGMKGIDIAIETIKILVKRNIKFHWYFLGKGPFQTKMEEFFFENGLNYNVTLLGISNNPYPLYIAADLYVQTSRSESYGMSIAEARLLNLPVVTTRLDTVFGQMVHERNGLVTDMNAEAVANAIERLMKDKNLYDSIVRNLKQEMKENVESIKLFNAMIEKLLLEKADGKL